MSEQDKFVYLLHVDLMLDGSVMEKLIDNAMEDAELKSYIHYDFEQSKHGLWTEPEVMITTITFYAKDEKSHTWLMLKYGNNLMGMLRDIINESEDKIIDSIMNAASLGLE